jgi:hypothetical protein
MKKLILFVAALAVLVPACAKITPTPKVSKTEVPAKLEYCAFLGDKATQYTVYANVLSKDQFIKAVADNATATTPDVAVQDELLKIGALSWKYKAEDPTVVGLAVFDSCVQHKVTKKQTNKFVPPPGPKFLA